MTSILKVDNIKDSADNQAISISGGVVTFANNPAGIADSGAMMLLQTITISSGVSTVDLENVFTSTYKNYKIIANNISIVSPDASLLARIKKGTDSGFDATTNAYSLRNETFSNANNNYSGFNDTSTSWNFIPSGAQEDGTNAYPSWLEMDIYDPSNTTSSQGASARYDIEYLSYHPYKIGNRGHLFHTNNDWKGIQFLLNSSATFASGTIKLYGIK